MELNHQKKKVSLCIMARATKLTFNNSLWLRICFTSQHEPTLLTTCGQQKHPKHHLQGNEMTDSIKIIGFLFHSCYQADLITTVFSHKAEP